MKSFTSSALLVCSMLWMSVDEAESQTAAAMDLTKITNVGSLEDLKTVNDLTTKQNLTKLDYNPLKVLGKEDTYKIKSSWALTVNDQCLYEFVFQFEHASSFPIGDVEHDGTCDFGTMDDPVKPKIAEDGQPYLKPRRYWQRFPNYVWATIGFNHLSVDWQACGRKPAGYRQPQYDMSFYRVTPEYRVNNMVCKVYDEPWMTIVPFEDYCFANQDDIKGMNFFIYPAAMKNQEPMVNMPFEYTHRKLTYGPQPYEGLRAWDESRVPDKPEDWNDLPVYMSSYAGNVVSWQAHIPYKFINGDKRQFHSLAQRYWETTVQTMPDTWAVKYDERDGKIYFTIVGKSELCREDFERAEAAAGGPPTFPDYPDEMGPTEPPTSMDGAGVWKDDADGYISYELEEKKPNSVSGGSSTSIYGAAVLQVVLLAIALTQSL